MTKPVVVAGAGIGGLCAALALIRRGFDVVVCEQASELREVGAGVQLSPNGTRVLAELGVLDDLRAVAVEAEAKEIRLWNTGETWPLFDLGKSAMAEDGLLLARCLAAYRDDSPAAIRAYEALRVERANRCVRAADHNREIFHNDRLLDRADAARYVSTRWSERK